MSNITHATELREVYLFTYDSFGVTPHDVVDGIDSVTNVRFARELLGTLVGAGLVSVDDVNDDGDIWQTVPTYDDMERNDAEVKIDDFLNTQPANKENSTMATATATKPKSTKVKPAATFHECYCGCGENVPAKSFYRPGHDARHAGVIGRLVAEDGDMAHYNDLPSERLVLKSKAITIKALEKKQAKSAKRAPEYVEGTLTVGKKERIGRKSTDGVVEFMDDKGNWNPASKTAASTFEA